MRIGERIVGEGREPLMVAEEGQANQGDMGMALEMTRLAAECGADGIEFQFFLADDMYVLRDPGHATYKSRELAAGQIRDIIAAARDRRLICQIAGLSPAIIELCAEAGADLFVVNATDLNNPQIIDAVAATGRPFWLATLMGTIEEIDWAVDYALGRCRADIGLLHGQHVMSSDTSRGVPPELLQLDCIELFKRRYGLATGFVDHTVARFVPALAAAKGAALITKHLSPDATWRGPDWVVCLDPQGWKEARDVLRYGWTANGASKEISQMEFKDRSVHRRSLYTRTALHEGHRLAASDLVALRPGKGGLDPKLLHGLLGRKLRAAVPEQHQLQPGDLVEG